MKRYRPQWAINALARDIAEDWTGMPAYLVDDETFEAATVKAEATYQPPPPKSELQRAIDRAQHPDPVESIRFLNEATRLMRVAREDEE